MAKVSQKYIIQGDPIALARARSAHGRFYDSQKQLKLVTSLDLINQHENKPMFKGPLHMDVVFYLGMSKVAQNKLKEKILYHIFKPDISNLIKYIEDVGSTILYEDDCIIASINARKLYSLTPRTELIITELK